MSSFMFDPQDRAKDDKAAQRRRESERAARGSVRLDFTRDLQYRSVSQLPRLSASQSQSARLSFSSAPPPADGGAALGGGGGGGRARGMSSPPAPKAALSSEMTLSNEAAAPPGADADDGGFRGRSASMVVGSDL